MGIYDYIILSVIAVCLIAAVIYLFRLKRKGKSLCCGDCSACRSCTAKCTKQK